MNKSPCFPMYPSDFYGDPKVRIMSPESKAFYALLLMNIWDYDTQYSIPDNDETISKILEITLEKWMKMREEIISCFIRKNGRYISRRLKAEKDKQSKYRKLQSEKGKLGGRPQKAVALPEESHGKADVKPPNPNPIYKPIKDNNKAQPKNKPFVLPEFIPKKTWEAYLALRTKKRAAQTEYALNLIIEELEKIKKSHGNDPVDVLNKSIKNGWIDVYPLKDSPGGNGNGTSRTYDTNRGNYQSAYRGTGRQPADLSADVLQDIAEANRLAADKKAADSRRENTR